MPASTALITDMNTAIAAGPTAATTALANAAGGPILDMLGNWNLALTKLKETQQLLTQTQKAMDSSDPSKTTIANVLLSLT